MRGSFRQDIQGLRAVAVLLVAVDHAHIGPFTGGYVGVDVFFVISGFLITSLLLREAQSAGRFSLRDFYARRARRILPAALLVIMVTLFLSVYLLDGAAALDVGGQGIWATFFAANIKFAADGTDYFAAGAPPSPLQHYWSLSVEEQFYLAWPLVLLAALWALRRRLGTPHRAAVPVLTVVVLGSFAWSLVLTSSNPIGAYFSTTARAWELGLGALTAALAPRIARLAPALLTSASWLGLAMIGAASVLYTEQTPFPGSAAALPVVGAALLLGGGINARSWGPQRALSAPPMRAVGDWSYSFYLWHWPAIIFAKSAWGPVHGWSGVLVLGVALGVSVLSYRYVETPFREGRMLRLSRTRALLLYPATIVIVLPAVAVAGHVVRAGTDAGGPAISLSDYGQRPGDPRPAFSDDPTIALVQASVLAAENEMALPAGLEPNPLDLRKSIPDLGDCQYFGMATAALHLCPHGDPGAERVMVLIGDSHARQWIPALDEIARDRGFRAYFLVREGCPAIDQTPWRSNGVGPNLDCQAFQDWAVSTVAGLEPAITLLATDANEGGYADEHGRHVTDDDTIAAMVESGMAAEIEKIAPHSSRVVVIGDPPIHSVSPIRCLTKRHPTLRGCLAPPTERSLQMRRATRRAAAASRAEYIDTTPWFCFRGECPTVVGRIVTHRDPEHITIDYSRHLIPVLARALHLNRS